MKSFYIYYNIDRAYVVACQQTFLGNIKKNKNKFTQ